MVQLIVRACDEAFPLFEPFALFSVHFKVPAMTGYRLRSGNLKAKFS
jgi:hypothetical protein